jgi:hypothetical protein
MEQVMGPNASDAPAATVPFAPKSKGQPEANIVVDDAGRAILALLRKAAEKAKEDCVRAMDIAHKLSSQLEAAEKKASELELEAAHFRDRSTRAEEWLLHIHNEVEHTFFQKKERPRQGPEQ